MDTNVLSELTKRRPNAGAIAWLASQKTVTISAITIDELSFGVLRAPATQRAHLTTWLDALMAAGPTIVAVDRTVAHLSGELRARAATRGRSAAQADMLIAASALLGGHTLVTRNVRDFEGTGVTLLNPFS